MIKVKMRCTSASNAKDVNCFINRNRSYQQLDTPSEDKLIPYPETVGNLKIYIITPAKDRHDIAIIIDLRNKNATTDSGVIARNCVGFPNREIN